MNDDIEDRQRLEQLLDFYGFLIQANGLIARAESLPRLYGDICRLGIRLNGRLVLAWVGLLDGENGHVRVAASEGRAQAYLEGVEVNANTDSALSRGPTGRALHHGRCVVVNRFQEDPDTAPWHAQAKKFGLASAASLPLLRNDVVCGALTLYGDTPDLFEESFAGELEVLAQTLSYAIDAAAGRASLRLQAERWLALSRLAQSDGYIGAEGEHGFLCLALEDAERLTASRYGFLHLVGDDQQGSELVAWTGDGLGANGFARGQSYPVGAGGIWVESFHARQGLIVNDASQLAGNDHGVRRLISVPVIEDDKVRVIAWVGDKEEPYDQDDLEFLQVLAADAWRVVRRRRDEQNLAASLATQQALNRKLEDAQNQLLQSEKMASIGQLAAGVAHELNNPIGFVNSNIGTLKTYLDDIFHIVAECEAAAASANHPEDFARVEAAKQDKDFDYLKTDIFQLLEESADGLHRVKKIVQDLKDFSRPGESEWQWADLNQGIESTLNIVWNELKYKCTVKKEYGSLPQVHCLLAQLNQVFMNLLVNASHAIETQGEVVITTRRSGADEVQVIIADNGKGIAPEHLTRIFDPFFTTKPVGKGTGLGLSIVWGIIQKHGGTIEVNSTVGKGTTFTITLPVDPVAASASLPAADTVPPAPTFQP